METLGMTDPSKFTDIVEHYQVGKLSTTGTCTVLAIRTATALDYANRGVYNFLMYDVGGHKVCRCLSTYIIIGSSSRDGAVIKAPGDEWTYKSRKFVWQFTNKSGHRFSKGFMKWFLEGDDKGADSGLFSRYLFMAADLKTREDNDKEKIWRIVWRECLPDYQDKVGTAATNNHCRQQMRIFVGKFGSRRQWRHDKCGRVHHRIWDALVEQYGYPVLERG
ncbi:hypothetical protein FOIG_10319 [Fusarium odoratissimum NRRL 54006]|uniref:Uncharacterized protein n=2 Tax=Fusarium oxysporum species complex TaxID=171631 RepID=X0J7Z5_FUSO5|nr:uncharacterized protein FOIG_10319 [Fusarium odoratissimum NRRL 54006]EXL97267.1 hypothetical protein FOIG_10319 [Fusarium odoratissimum NRRL 54006]TXB95880.1 hypothetical protein FocTR4_00016096 [Fusarium oxysporum f. sp. cubense]